MAGGAYNQLLPLATLAYLRRIAIDKDINTQNQSHSIKSAVDKSLLNFII